MHLRKLNIRDADRILEWIKDPEINKYFRFDPDKMNRDDVISFIEKAQNESKDIHMAATDDNDRYLGTVSLKNINYNDKNAEYAISLHKDAVGSGVAKFATEEIIKIAFTKLNLERIYLNVFSDNSRAINFYNKMGFKYEGELEKHLQIRGEFKSLKLFAILKK